LLFSKDEEGEGFTDVVTELSVVGGLELGDGVIDLVVDLGSVDDDVVANVIGEGEWVGEDFGHLLELLPVGNDSLALLDVLLDLNDGFAEHLESLNGALSGVLLEVLHGSFDLGEESFGILDTSLNVLESLSIDGTLKNSDDDLLNVGWVNGLLGGNLLLSKGSDEDLGKSVSDLLSSWLVLGSFEVADGSLNLLEDVSSIDENILTNVHGKSLWVLEGLNKLNDFLELGNVLGLGALSDSGSNGVKCISNILESLGNSSNALLLKLGNGILDVSGNMSSILARCFQRQCPVSYLTLKSLSPRSSERDAVSRL